MVPSLQDIAAKILSLPRKNRQTLIVGIDGHGGSGKSTFAAALTKELQARGTQAHIVSLDGFPLRKNPGDLLSLPDRPDVSTPFRIDAERVLREVLQPLAEDKLADYAHEDWWDRAKTERRHIAPGGIVLVEGCYALLPELRPFYDLKILIDIDAETRRARAVNRDLAAGGDPAIAARLWAEIYEPHEQHYMEQEGITKIADIIVPGLA